MDETLAKLLTWLAPIISTLVICVGQAAINTGQRRLDTKMDERHREAEDKRAADIEWRARVDSILSDQEKFLKTVAEDKREWHEWRKQLLKRLDSQDRRTGSILEAQCSQIRSDLLHKCHRYIDDLGCASIEEKDALKSEHNDYARICEIYGIENSFIDKIVAQALELPNRPSGS